MRIGKVWIVLLTVGGVAGWGCGDTEVILSGDIEKNPPIGEGEWTDGDDDNDGNGSPNNQTPNGTPNANNNDPPNTNNNDPSNHTNNDPPNNTNNDPPNNTNNDPPNSDPNGDPPELEEGFCEGSFSGCGGNPSGQWVADRFCTDTNVEPAFIGLPSECDDWEVEDFDIQGSGSLSLDGGDGFEHQVSAQVSGTVNVPAACEDEMDGCDVIENNLQDQFTGVDITCSEGGGCDCSIEGSLTIDRSGTYELISGRIEATVGGQVISYDYCAQSGWLTLQQMDEADYFPLAGRYEGQ